MSIIKPFITYAGPPARAPSGLLASRLDSEWGMIRSETLIELKFVNSSFSSLSSYCN